MTKRLGSGKGKPRRVEGSGVDRALRRMAREIDERPAPTHATAKAPVPDSVSFARSCGLDPDPWQVGVLTSTARTQLLLCSRQAGKSTTTACLALYEAAYRPGSLVLLLSKSLDQSKELHRKLTQLSDSAQANGAAMPSMLPGSVLKSEFTNGSRVIALPGNEDTIRGYSGASLIVIDEAARVGDEMNVAIQPSRATVADSRFIAMTTPAGRRGWFYKEWTESPDAERTTITAYQVPRISKAFLADQRRMLGEFQFRQEYEVAWLDMDSAVFSSELVRRAVRADVTPLFPDLLSAYAA